MRTNGMMNARRFVFAGALAALFLGMAAPAVQAKAPAPWSKKEQAVVNRITSGIKSIDNFATAVTKARPPVRIVKRGPLAVSNYVKQLSELSRTYRKSLGYKRQGRRSMSWTLISIKKQDLSKRGASLRDFATRLEKRHNANKGKALQFVKDSPDKNRINNHSRSASGKLGEAVRMAKGL